MIKYTKVSDSVFEIQAFDDFDTTTNILEDSLDYFNSWPNGEVPKYDLPYQTDSVLAPKNYLVLQKNSIDLDQDKLQKILNYILKYPLLVQGIYFISKDWLILDEHKIIKAEGNVNYIFVKNNLYKVFDKNTSVRDLVKLNDIGPNSWFWRVKI